MTGRAVQTSISYASQGSPGGDSEQQVVSRRDTPLFALIGNPNCGKSTVFNALTGLRQKVGNYPGVTVERKVGECFSQHGNLMRIIDLPGTYSLAARSPDEAVARDVLLGRRRDMPPPDRVICIIDASNLERNLYLATQVIELGLPTILVLNMMDLVRSAGVEINVGLLERALGVPVIPCEAHNGKGLLELRLAMSRPDLPPSEFRAPVPEAIRVGIDQIASAGVGDLDAEPTAQNRVEASLLLTDREDVQVSGSTTVPDPVREMVGHWTKRWQREDADWRGAIVGSRYEAIAKVCGSVMHRSAHAGPNVSDRIDAVVVHPVWGWFVFAGIMTTVFMSIFSFAEYPMNLIDGWMGAMGNWIAGVMPPGALRDLIVTGAIAGTQGVVIFLPQILILFFFIGLLENTGYMARAAFIMDRTMSFVGLNGKSFIPLLSSHACAIPGIMATRTIEDWKDRLVTILVAPLMSCSARLPVYLLMIAALMPDERVPIGTKVGLMVLMYGLGLGGAFAFAWLFKKYLLKSAAPLMIMELPPYRWPKFRGVVLQMFERAGLFLRRAGTIILGISIVLWFLAAYPQAGPDAAPGEQVAQSFAGMAGHALEPVIKPLGFDWRIGIGLISSFAAREVFNSSMGVVFAVQESNSEEQGPLLDALVQAHWPDGSPLFTPLVAFTLMIFYVFAMQCMSTVAVVKRETNSWRWPLFQIAYMTGTAYVASLIVYQGGRLLGFG